MDVQLRDYREAAGSYDVVLSVEMIEAVGERYWPAYFTAIDRLLAPGGRAGLQAITDALREHTSLRVTADYPMGQHYARTLAEWRGRFAGAAGPVRHLGFGPTFQRMWNLYLAYSEGGFRSGYLDAHQLVLERSS